MPVRDAVSQAAPPVLLAVAVSGFWLYLGALDLVGMAPRSALTAGYYALLASALLVSAWSSRKVIRERLRSPSRLPRVWAVAAGTLAAWFLLNVALLSSGVAARDAAALLLLSSLPSALVALSLTRHQLTILAGAWVALGLGLLVVSVVTLIARPDETGRFSPIDEFDPITAAHVASLSAIALMVFRFADRRARIVQAVGVMVLIALSVLPASRGALLALLVALVALACVLRRRLLPLLLPAVVAGFLLGGLATTVVGADYYYSIDVPGLERRVAPPSEGEDFTGERIPEASGPPISSLSIRRHLWAKSLRDWPDRPLFGHGVGMLVDDSPETLRMARAGRVELGVRTYPHNVLIESLYSLGIVGLCFFLVAAVSSLVALALVLRRGAGRFESALVLGFGAFVAVNSMVSGEIGSDAVLWVAMALPVSLFADSNP